MQAKRERKTVPNPHDAFFRRLFARPALAAEFFRLYLPPRVAARLDLSRVQLEEAAFVDKKLREHFSDLLFRVGLKGGGEAFVFILLEHKSAPDERVALQVLRYMVQAWDRLPAPLPLIIPVVVYHGARPWRVGKRLGAMFAALAQLPYWRRYLPDFEYHLCDLSRYREQDLQGKEGLAAVLSLLKYVFSPELTAKLPSIFKQTAVSLPEALAEQQMETMVHYLNEAGRISQTQIGAALKEAQASGGSMENVWENVLKEYSRLVGLDQGLEAGRQEGAAEMVLRQLHRQIGKLAPTTETQVRALPLQQLLQLGEDLFKFKTAEDLDKWLRRAAAPARKRARRVAAN